MFTGLIEVMGKVLDIERSGAAATLTVAADLPQEEIRPGDSIAVNGICLTVVGKGGGTFTFDVSPETLERSAFKGFRAGAPVNLERALRLSDRLGGHIVSGHVDCIASVTERRTISGNVVFSFGLPREFARYVVAKGSVAIDGISLTVNTVAVDGFSVNVIPHTAAKTTLNHKRAGDEVNIETDILGKYVERLLVRRSEGRDEGVTLELLAKNGFL
ncbi:MAG: riboflavin [Geobacteraceae bacterium]|nr:MAG: riboflavin [Geobacteraceae bacterium]